MLMLHAMKMVVPLNTAAKPRVDVNRTDLLTKWISRAKIPKLETDILLAMRKINCIRHQAFRISYQQLTKPSRTRTTYCNIELLVLDTVPKRCKSQAAKILSYIK